MPKGWNLIGVEHNIDNLSILKNIDIAWMYNNNTKKWEVYSPMADIKNDINSLPYGQIDSIPAGSGVWIYRKIDLPKFKYFDYEVLEKNENEAKVRLKANISLPQEKDLFYEAKTYDNGKEIDLAYFPPIERNYSIADINLTNGYHKITICQDVYLSNFSLAEIRYNVCKSLDINVGLPYFGNEENGTLPSFDSNSTANAIYDFYGNIIDSNNNPLDNVKIILQLPDKNITTPTDTNGHYILKVDENISFPVLITAYKDGYLPVSKNIFKYELSYYKTDFKLKKQSDELIIDKSLHHLGDNSYSGTINSKFQAKSQGIVYKKDFNVSYNFLNDYKYVVLSLYVKGAQYNNPMYINGKLIYYLDKSPSDGSFGKVNINVPISYLKNENKLQVSSTLKSDYDDFEFANIQLKGEL